MSTWTASGTFIGPSGPLNGATVYAWKAQRFAAIPAQDAVAPPGTADAGPVTTGTSFGGSGQFAIQCPTNEAYYIAITFGGHTYWLLNNDLAFTDAVETTVAAGSNGATLTSLIAGSLDVLSTAGYAGNNQINVTTNNGQAVLSYTSVTGGGTPSFNGIAIVSGTGSWVVNTGNAVTSTQEASTLNQVIDDGVGNASVDNNLTVPGTLKWAASATTGAGASTPVFTSGTALQLSATKNGFLYIDVTTAASLTIAIGPTTPNPANTLQSAVVGALGMMTIFVPAAWYVKLTGTMADLAFTYITC